MAILILFFDLIVDDWWWYIMTGNKMVMKSVSDFLEEWFVNWGNSSANRSLFVGIKKFCIQKMFFFFFFSKNKFT